MILPVEQLEEVQYFSGRKRQKGGDTTIREFTTTSSPMGGSSRASLQQPQPQASSLYEYSSGAYVKGFLDSVETYKRGMRQQLWLTTAV